MKKSLLALILALIAYAGYVSLGSGPQPPASGEPAAHSQTRNPAAGEQVRGVGVVEKILGDDREGSRHQRFILRLASGQTLLIAHNIDLAPRIPNLRNGDTVEYHGEYEPNPRGGVVHWTHRDPSNQHPAGWLKHQGRVFQ